MTRVVQTRRVCLSNRPRASAWLLLAAVAAAPALAGPMEQEQLFDVPVPAQRLHPRMQGLLSKALDQPDRLTRIEALADVTRHRLVELAPRVAKLLTDPSPLVRGSALQALVALDARDQQEAVLAILRASRWGGEDEADVLGAADLALAAWGVDAATAIWLARMQEGKAPAALLKSAAAGLGRAPAAATESAWRVLTAIVRDSGRPPDLRLICARSAAGLAVAPMQQESFAAELVDRPSGFEHLLAAEILQKTGSPGAVAQLLELVSDGEGAVRVAAMRALLRAAPRTLAERAEAWLGAEDAETRLLAVRALETRAKAGLVSSIGALLDDHHPAVRQETRRVLLAFAREGDLADLVRVMTRDVLVRSGSAPGSPASTPSWRAAEQAAMISAALDDKAAAEPLVQLLKHERFEPRLAAVAALRRLNVRTTHASMLRLLRDLVAEQVTIHDRIEALQLHRTTTNDPRRAEAMRLSGLADRNDRLGAEAAQALGSWRLAAAEPFLRRLVPKDVPAGGRFRTASIWALGCLREDREEPALARQLLERAFDLSLTNPEFESVRRASVVALGRMRARSVVKGLRDRYENDGPGIRAASRWALGRITGETLPAISSKPHIRTDAFLSPLP